jgi:hypothetical protein
MKNDSLADQLHDYAITCEVAKDARSDAAEFKRLDRLIEAFKAVPLYIEEPNWSAPEDERDLLHLCIGCGFPGKGDHDGDETCPVAVVERLLSEDKTIG